MVERPRLFEVHAQTPPGNVDRGQAALVIELLDRPDRSVGDVQGAITLPKLDAVPHGEAARLQADHLERPPLLRVDDAWQTAALELQP
jgi:hypothetical protein